YLPRVGDAGAGAGAPGAAAPATSRALEPRRGHETVMPAEDAALVRTLARRGLEGYGYTVLEAPDGQRALELAERYSGAIDLLVTDVVMPGLGGRELA